MKNISSICSNVFFLLFWIFLRKCMVLGWIGRSGKVSACFPPTFIQIRSQEAQKTAKNVTQRNMFYSPTPCKCMFSDFPPDILSGKLKENYPENKCGGRHRENRQGKDFGGFDGYLEGMFGNPSIVKIQCKTAKKQEKTRKPKTSVVFLIFPLCRPPWWIHPCACCTGSIQTLSGLRSRVSGPCLSDWTPAV